MIFIRYIFACEFAIVVPTNVVRIAGNVNVDPQHRRCIVIMHIGINLVSLANSSFVVADLAFAERPRPFKLIILVILYIQSSTPYFLLKTACVFVTA